MILYVEYCLLCLMAHQNPMNEIKSEIIIFTESKTDKICETVISKYFDEHNSITLFQA